MEDLKAHRLDARLAKLVHDVYLQSLSRHSASRLSTTAVPQIGLIELVSPEVFEPDYQGLYLSMFHGDERESPERIVQRLQDDFAGLRGGLAPYRVIGIRDADGKVIGASQLSVLMLRSGKYAVPYVQYIYVHPDYRRYDLSEVLHIMSLAVATADAQANGAERTVPFTFFETEPPNHGVSDATRANATQRTAIHAKSGSQALMLRNAEGRITSCHIQPGLEVGEKPVGLIWVIRPSPAAQTGDHHDLGEISPDLIQAYYQSFRDEGFVEDNIALAERLTAKRMEGCNFVQIPLADVTMAMYQGIDEVDR